MKNLLVAGDLSARSDRAFARAVQLMAYHDARLTVLHVLDGDLPRSACESEIAFAGAELEEALGGLTKSGNPNLAIKVATGSAVSEILETAEKESCDLIVLGRHRNESCPAPFESTTAGRLVRSSCRPVLVVADRVSKTYGRVMVGVDFSAPSRRALRTAFELAPEADFHVVHAFDVPFQGFLPGQGTRSEVEDEHERALCRLIETEVAALSETPNSRFAGSPRVEKILCKGDVEGVLRREAGRIRPDLLAIGTHGRSGVARAIIGSVAQDMLDRPPCDVLAVR